MRMRLLFMSIVVIGLAALVTAEKRKPQSTVGPNAFLYLVADTEHEITRLPVVFTRLSDEEEIMIGGALSSAIQTQHSAEDDRIESYIAQVGTRVAAHAHRKLPYRFHYIPDMGFVNGFALPGGHVYIGAGLMALMGTEDELASVLGHEIEHIDHYHCAERAQLESALRKVPLGGAVAIPLIVFEVGYSKTQELEADREGTILSTSASYSPEGSIRIFESFDRVEQEHAARKTPRRRPANPAEEISEVAHQTLSDYFRTHPPSNERIAQIRSLIAAGTLADSAPRHSLQFDYVFLTRRAAQRLSARDYQEASELAARSVASRPDQPQALSILGQAKLALGDYETAKRLYGQLVDKNPAEAAEIATLGHRLASQAVESRKYDDAIRLARQTLELQPNKPEVLATLGIAQIELLDFDGALITGRKLTKLYHQADALVAHANSGAAAALAAHDYTRAAHFSELSLNLQPMQTDALTTLATAQFASANFRAAAETYRKIFARGAFSIDLLHGYAETLGTLKPAGTGIRQLEALLMRFQSEHRVSQYALDIGVELDGLRLMSGEKEAARDTSAVSPELMGRKGHWYYRAGDYRNASILLSNATRQRPDDLVLQRDLAWVELEQQQWNVAVQRFTAPSAGRAVGYWKSGRTQQAVEDFDIVLKETPEWSNSAWVSALFSPLVSQTMRDIAAEHNRQLQQKKQKPSRR